MTAYPFLFDERYRRAARPFGITPQRAMVEVEDGELRARYGRWAVHTPLSNIARVSITGPYRFAKTAGPPRLGITDRGLTFASNGARGVQLDIREPITGVDRFGLIKHPNLTLTVADCDALAEALRV